LLPISIRDLLRASLRHRPGRIPEGDLQVADDVPLVRGSLRRRAYGFFPATVIPITSLGSAGVYFGNTRAFVACSKS
jgi:hypothetical protein